MNIDVDKLDRIEVINHAGTSQFLNFGRCFGAFKDLNDFSSLEFSLQDGNKTLKIFLDK